MPAKRNEWVLLIGGFRVVEKTPIIKELEIE